jgi:hypothetical protein
VRIPIRKIKDGFEVRLAKNIYPEGTLEQLKKITPVPIKLCSKKAEKYCRVFFRKNDIKEVLEFCNHLLSLNR